MEANDRLVVGRLQPATVRSRALLVALVDQETGQRGYVLTGNPAFLQPYREGNTQLRVLLAQLRSGFRGDPADVEGHRPRRRRREDTGAGWPRVPEIAARSRGDRSRAELLVQSGRGKRAFDTVRGRVAALERLIDARSLRAQRGDRGAVTRLRAALLVSWLLLALILAVGALLLRRWVLGPVNALRGRMRLVAAGRLDEQVLVDGPPEVAAIAHDAENMRRRIVAELEATRGATEALSQHSPVVSALRGAADRARRTRTRTAWTIVGAVRSAEGVLAGDWWEALRRPDGTTALVLADVSGHGAEAGLVAFAFKHRITALLDTDLDLGDGVHAGGPAARRRRRALPVLPRGGRRPRRAASWPGSTPATRRAGRRDRGPGPGQPSWCPTGPLISSVTRGWTVGRDVVRPRRPAGGLHRRGARGPRPRTARVRHRRPAGRGAAAAHAGRRRRRWPSRRRRSAGSRADVRRDDVTCVALALSPAARRAAPA